MSVPAVDQELCVFWLPVLLLCPLGAKRHMHPVLLNCLAFLELEGSSVPALHLKQVFEGCGRCGSWGRKKS